MSVQISENATVSVTNRHAACEVSDETVILHLHEGVYYGLNAVGSCVWRQIQHPRRISEVVDAVLVEFDVDRPRCVADVRELIGALLQRELVTVEEETQP